jgi:hypothetical protein
MEEIYGTTRARGDFDNRRSCSTIVVGHSYGGQGITALGSDAPNVELIESALGAYQPSA